MRKTQRLVTGMALAALAVLTACSGVGNSNLQPTTYSSKTPVVVNTSSQFDAAPNRPIYVRFSHDMDAATINANTFKVDGVQGSVRYDAKNRMAYFWAPGGFAGGAIYNASVSTGAKDKSGAALPAKYAFAVQTLSDPDTTSPTVALVAGCVATSGPVRVQFSEAMDSSTINESTFLVDGFTGTVTYDSITKIASFTPDTPFTAGATYTLTITSGATDLAGNPIVGNVDYDFIQNFTVCSGGQNPTFCTYTKGGFQGNGTPGQFLDANFATVFSSGLTIGIFDGGGSLHNNTWSGDATGAAALKTFLTSPAGGASSALGSDRTNPTATDAGQLPEQVAALTLNVGFSGVGNIPAGFGDLILTGTGTSLDGSSVSDILAMANIALAGGGLPSGFSFSSLNDLITNLNEAFDNCQATDWAKVHLVVD